MFKIILFILTAWFTIGFSSFCNAQNLENYFLPDNLGFSNQLEYSYDINRKLEIFENWLNVDYRKGIFGAGIRFETFQPNDPDPSISRGKYRYAGVAYKYINANIGDEYEGFDITIGNFYALFGRGLVLKSYEDRSIRIDNNLLGVKLNARYTGLNLIAITSTAANAENERKDILHAVDIEYKILKQLNIGGSFASNLPENEDVSHTMLSSLRIIPVIWNFDMYFEYGVKMNNDDKRSSFNNSVWKVGEAYYAGLDFYYNTFSLTTEYKYYDNFTFTSYDGTIIYNTPPSVRKDYTFILLNRHPSVLNQSNEQGFQFDLNYSLSDNTSFTCNYGETRTLSPASYYKKIFNDNTASKLLLRDLYAQVCNDWNDNWTTIAAFGYNKEQDTDTKNVTPIIENRFYFNEINTIKFIIEHQQTKIIATNEEYYNDLITLEYLRSPNFSVSIISEMQKREPIAGRKILKFWNSIRFGYKIDDHTDLNLLLGTRQAGNICIGGVCRYEPEFRGVEVKIFTRF